MAFLGPYDRATDLTPNQVIALEHLRETAKGMYLEIVNMGLSTPMHPRYQALAQTALEEAAMWAAKGITHNGVPTPAAPQQESE